MKKMKMKNIVMAYQTQHELSVLQERIPTFRKRLMNICDSLEEKLPKYTGWFVLLKRTGKLSALEGSWKFLGFYNPDVSPEDAEPEWDLCIPISEPETVEEFQGW